MANNARPVPDLQTVLATLAQFSNPPQNIDSHPSLIKEPIRQAADIPIASAIGPVAPAAAFQNHQPQHSPQIDPTSITDLAVAQRFVAKSAKHNVTFINRIRKMIQSQRANEMRWYKERQALKHRLAQSDLHLPTESPNTVMELATRDRKLHQAQRQMEEDFVAQLRGLSVPFFCTRLDLLETEDEATYVPDTLDGDEIAPVKLSRDELLRLQRAMVEQLESICEDRKGRSVANV